MITACKKSLVIDRAGWRSSGFTVPLRAQSGVSVAASVSRIFVRSAPAHAPPCAPNISTSSGDPERPPRRPHLSVVGCKTIEIGGRRRRNFRHPSSTLAHPDDLQESRFSMFLTVFPHVFLDCEKSKSVKNSGEHGEA